METAYNHVMYIGLDRAQVGFYIISSVSGIALLRDTCYAFVTCHII